MPPETLFLNGCRYVGEPVHLPAVTSISDLIAILYLQHHVYKASSLPSLT